MTKLFLTLLLAVFMVAGTALGLIFAKWNAQRVTLSWELMRQRGYDYLHRSKKDFAMEFFEKGKLLSSELGTSDYRYADSLVDIASQLSAQNDFDGARKLLRQADAIFERASAGDLLKNNALRNDRLRSYCLLANVELKSKKFERAQKLCQKILELKEQQNIVLEALTRRQIASTLLAAGDFAGTQQNAKLAQSLYKDALALTSNMPPFSDLEKAAQTKLSGGQLAVQSITASELLEKGAYYLKKRQFVSARQYLQKARELALAGQEPILMQIDFHLARLELSSFNFEQAEASLLSLLNDPNFKDNTALDEVLTKLTLIYRNCGYMEDATRVLRREVELRRQEYGSDSAKVTAIELELAQTLESIGQYAEAQKISLRTMSLKQSLGDEEDSAKLAGVILRTGEVEKAKPMLERIVFGFQNGSVKLGHSPIQASYQLAAIYMIEGKDAEANNLMAATRPYLAELQPIQQILVSEIMLDSALALKKYPSVASRLLRESILSLPEVADRRSALRCMKALGRIEPLRLIYPRVFDAEVGAKMKTITKDASSYAPAKLKGYSGMPSN